MRIALVSIILALTPAVALGQPREDARRFVNSVADLRLHFEAHVDRVRVLAVTAYDEFCKPAARCGGLTREQLLGFAAVHDRNKFDPGRLERFFAKWGKDRKELAALAQVDPELAREYAEIEAMIDELNLKDALDESETLRKLGVTEEGERFARALVKGADLTDRYFDPVAAEEFNRPMSSGLNYVKDDSLTRSVIEFLERKGVYRRATTGMGFTDVRYRARTAQGGMRVDVARLAIDDRALIKYIRIGGRQELVAIAMNQMSRPEAAARPELLRSMIQRGLADPILVARVPWERYENSGMLLELMLTLDPYRRGKTGEEIVRSILAKGRSFPGVERLENVLLEGGLNDASYARIRMKTRAWLEREDALEKIMAMAARNRANDELTQVFAEMRRMSRSSPRIRALFAELLAICRRTEKSVQAPAVGCLRRAGARSFRRAQRPPSGASCEDAVRSYLRPPPPTMRSTRLPR